MIVTLTKEQCEENSLKPNTKVNIEEGIFRDTIQAMLKHYGVPIKDMLCKSSEFIADINKVVPNAKKISFFLYDHMTDGIFIIHDLHDTVKVTFDKKEIKKIGAPFHKIGALESYNV